MIVLDPNQIGNVDPTDPEILRKEREAEIEAHQKPKKEKHKARGKSSAMRRLRKKQKNVFDEKRVRSSHSQ